jgi:hypothetical protein
MEGIFFNPPRRGAKVLALGEEELLGANRL